jgi:hypothetical protein
MATLVIGRQVPRKPRLLGGELQLKILKRSLSVAQNIFSTILKLALLDNNLYIPSSLI